MLMLLVALGSQAPAPCPHAAAAGRETTTGWRAYRREAIAEAATYFAAADSLCPGDHATQIGLGFVLLRQSQPRGASASLVSPATARRKRSAAPRGSLCLRRPKPRPTRVECSPRHRQPPPPTSAA